MNVDVGIDESGEDEFARGIDDFCVWRHVEMDADAADGFVFDEDVGVRPSIRGDDFSALINNPIGLFLRGFKRAAIRQMRQ